MPLITAPGFYPEIGCRQYFDEPCPAPALTNSGVSTLLFSCPARFAYEHPAIGQREAEREATKAQYLGRLVHRLALDKGDDYEVSAFDDYRTKEAKKWKAAVELRGAIPVKKSTLEDAEAMASTIKDGIIRETRGEPYQTEVVIAWQVSIGGTPIWCRSMIDVWCPSLNLALDVKTIAAADDKSISRAFANGYAVQDTFYRRGIEALTKDPGRTRFGFLFVEKDEPFFTRYAEADEAFRYSAGLVIERAARLFARCIQSGEWPGYHHYTASPPAWWMNDLTITDYEEAA